MFDLLTQYRRASALPMTPGWAASVVLHAAIVGALVYEQVQNPSSETETWTEAIEGLTYIAPPNVNSAASRVQIRYEAGGGAEGDRPANAETGDLRALGEGAGESAVASVSGGDEDQDQIALETDDPFENAFSSVEVEVSAERNPASAAPAYPRELMSAGVEGYAAMRFVVDTTGRVDLTSIRILDATHPAFAAAVKQAMPGMLFSPARLGERPVRQLAEQLFRFQILSTAGVEEAKEGKVPPGASGATSLVRRPR